MKPREYLIGDVKTYGCRNHEQFLDELALLMIKHDIDHIDMGWKITSEIKNSMNVVEVKPTEFKGH